MRIHIWKDVEKKNFTPEQIAASHQRAEDALAKVQEKAGKQPPKRTRKSKKKAAKK